MIIYTIISIGSFGFLSLIKTKHPTELEISSLSGLVKTHPLMAFNLAVLMFSTAGIPPLAGFFTKFYILGAAMSRGLLIYAIIAIIFSVISAFYYLRIVKVMYFDDVKTELEFEDSMNGKLIIFITAIFNIIFIFFLDKIITLINNFITF